MKPIRFATPDGKIVFSGLVFVNDIYSLPARAFLATSVGTCKGTIMRQSFKNQRLPKIAVTRNDYDRLSDLALKVFDRIPDIAEELLAELQRAKIVTERAMRADVVQMGSTLEYRSDGGDQRQITLVYPADADIAQGKVSILTPIGAALIGLSEGQSMMWSTRDGRQRQLTVVSVKQPATAAAA